MSLYTESRARKTVSRQRCLMPNLRTVSNFQDPRSIGIHTHKHSYTDKQANVSTQNIHKDGKCSYSQGMELMHVRQCTQHPHIKRAAHARYHNEISIAPLSLFLTLNAGGTLRGSHSRPPVSWNDLCKKSWTGGRDLPQIITP